MLSEIVQAESEEVLIDGGLRPGELKRMLSEKYPDFSELSLVFFQNRQLCADGKELQPGTDIDCMPPFSGG